MFTFVPTNQFKKAKKQSAVNFSAVSGFLETLQANGVLGLKKKFKAHKLTGNGEVHITPDLLIIWFEISRKKEIFLLRTGSHSELF